MKISKSTLKAAIEINRHMRHQLKSLKAKGFTSIDDGIEALERVEEKMIEDLNQ